MVTPTTCGINVVFILPAFMALPFVLLVLVFVDDDNAVLLFVSAVEVVAFFECPVPVVDDASFVTGV